MKSMSTTRPDRRLAGAFPNRRRSGGFTIVSAIFILVVLAGLGAAILTVFTGQQMSSAADLQGSRAYWAARSAAEYGLMQVLDPEETALYVPPPHAATDFPGCMAFPAAVALPGVTGFTVQITNCVRDPAAGNYTDGGLNVVVYSITASATAGTVGTATYVEREVTVSAAKCKDPNALTPAGGPDARFRCG